MIVIGIDPGLTGACSVIDHNGLRAVFDLPTMQIPGVGPKALIQKKINAHAFCALLLKHAPASEGKPTVVIESVGTQGTGITIQSAASLLRSLGAIESVVECLRFPAEYAHVQTWKRFYGLIEPKHPNESPSQRSAAGKRRAMERARALYPACAEISRAKDHNRAEAILLAHWWRSNNVTAAAAPSLMEAA